MVDVTQYGYPAGCTSCEKAWMYRDQGLATSGDDPLLVFVVFMVVFAVFMLCVVQHAVNGPHHHRWDEQPIRALGWVVWVFVGPGGVIMWSTAYLWWWIPAFFGVITLIFMGCILSRYREDFALKA